MSDSNVKKFVPVKGQDLRDLTKDCKNMQEKHAKKYSFFGNMEEFTIFQKSTPEKKETETEGSTIQPRYYISQHYISHGTCCILPAREISDLAKLYLAGARPRYHLEAKFKFHKI